MLRFDYLKPSTVEEAIGLLQQHGDTAMLIAGGTDVMVAVKQRKIAPKVLISLRGVGGLSRIEVVNGQIVIGAMTTHRELETSPVVKMHMGALADAVSWLGSVQIRNVATVGGNVCNAAPSADTVGPLLVADASARIIGPNGERIAPLRDFFVGPGTTILTRGEIVTEFMVPAPRPGTASAYWKLTRRKAMDLPILGVAMSLSVDMEAVRGMAEILTSGASADDILNALEHHDVQCREARIALGVAAPTPMLAKAAADILHSVRLTRDTIDRAGRIASEEARPRDSVRGKAWYRKEMIGAFCRRLTVGCLKRIVS